MKPILESYSSPLSTEQLFQLKDTYKREYITTFKPTFKSRSNHVKKKQNIISMSIGMQEIPTSRHRITFRTKEAFFGPDRVQFKYRTFSVFIQSIINLLMASIPFIWNRINPIQTISPFSYAYAALSQTCSLYTAYYALDLIDYPTQALAKASKPIPVLIMGVFILRKRYSFTKYLTVFMVVAGITLFMQPQEKQQMLQGFDTYPTGFLLVLISLLFDGLTSVIQDHQLSKSRPTANELNFWTSFWISLIAFSTWLINNETQLSLQFCLTYPSIFIYIAAQAVSSSLGQVFIFRILHQFGALTLSIVTTSRKFFSILISIFWFGHPLTLLQWIAIAIVFTGLSIDILVSKKKNLTPQHDSLNVSNQVKMG